MRKIYSRLIGLIAAASMAISALPAVAAETGETYNSAENFPVFTENNWQGCTWDNGVWQAEIYNSETNTYADANYSYNGGFANDGWTWNNALIKGDMLTLAQDNLALTQHPVRTFVAPEAGTVRIEATDIVHNTDSKKVLFRISKNDTPIWSYEIEWYGMSGQPEQIIDVAQGDKIRFEAIQLAAREWGLDINWTNTVTYINGSQPDPGPTPEPLPDPSGDARFEFASNSAYTNTALNGTWDTVWSAQTAAFEGASWSMVYTDAPYTNGNDYCANWNGNWDGPLVNGENLYVGKTMDYNAPFTVRTFTAPRDGELIIKSADIQNDSGMTLMTRVVKQANDTDAAQQLWPTSATDTSTTQWTNQGTYGLIYGWQTRNVEELRVTVKAGDKISFEAGKQNPETDTAQLMATWINEIEYADKPDMGKPYFTNEAGSVLSTYEEIASADNAVLHIPQYEAFADAERTVVFAAYYDENGICKKVVMSNEFTDLSQPLAVQLGEGVNSVNGSIKVFVWDSANGMQPLADVFTVETSDEDKQIPVCFKNYDGSDKTIYVYKNTTFAELSQPERSGYKFGGWYIDEACENRAKNGDIVSNYGTVYVKWTGDGSADVPVSISDYFSADIKSLDTCTVSAPDSAGLIRNSRLEPASAAQADSFYGSYVITGSGNNTLTVDDINGECPAGEVIFYTELSDYSASGAGYGIALKGISAEQNGAQVTLVPSGGEIYYAEDGAWKSAPVSSDGTVNGIPSGYKGYVRIVFDALTYADAARLNGSSTLKKAEFEFNGTGDNGYAVFGGMFYFPSESVNNTVMEISGAYYELSRTSESIAVNAYDAYDNDAYISTRYSGTASEPTAKFREGGTDAPFGTKAAVITSLSDAKATTKGYMNTFVNNNAEIMMQPGVDEIMFYVELPEFEKDTTDSPLKLLDFKLCQGTSEAMLDFSNSIYRYADESSASWTIARAGADGELNGIPSGFKGFIKVDIKQFKNFVDIKNIDFSSPYYITKFELGINYAGGENDPVVIGGVYSIISDSNAAYIKDGMTGETQRFKADSAADKTAADNCKYIFTNDITGGEAKIYPIAEVQNPANIIEADTVLNSEPNAVAFAQDIADNKIGDFEKTGIDKMCHVSTFIYAQGNIYVSYYANTVSAEENPQYQSARLAYAPENNTEQKVILDIMQVGDDLYGYKVTGVYDTILMQKEDDPDNIYILWTASINDKYYRLYTVFNTKTEEFGEIGVNRFKVGDTVNDFSSSGMQNALSANGIGYKTFFSDIGIMQKLSTREENGELYYYTGSYSGNFTCIIKSKDLITWEYVAQPNEGAGNTGFDNATKWENAVYVIGDKAYYFVRQWDPWDEGGSNYGILTCYDLNNGRWSRPVLVGDCQSRSDFIYYKDALYLFYAPTDRNHIGILKVNESNLAESEVVLQADMNGSCFYPFVQYNSSGELCMSYTVDREHIRLASFTLSDYLN